MKNLHFGCWGETDHMPVKILYFGCWGEAGHVLWQEGHRSARCAEAPSGVACPFRSGELDGGVFLPGGPKGDLDGNRQPQSLCKLTHDRGWTLLACWDRTGDSRYNSNSTFLAEGDHDFMEMVAMAKVHFPEVVERIEKAATLVCGK